MWKWMVIGLWSTAVLAVSRPYPGEVLSLQNNLTETAGEALLHLSYRLQCDDGISEVPALLGKLTYGKQVLRIDAYQYESELSILLGAVSRLPKDLSLQWEASSHCELNEMKAEIKAIEEPKDAHAALVLKHSPLVMVREDQLKNRVTDMPFRLGYSLIENQDKLTIKYTLFLTDEDSLSTISQLNGQKARYGRTSDIEWIYEVTLDPVKKEPIRTYHSAAFAGFGHATSPFSGEVLPETSHPILFIAQKHNVFSHQGTKAQSEKGEGYFFLPEEIKRDEARERVMERHPWSHLVCDRECQRENKLSVPMTDHLLVRMKGELKRGSFQAKVEFADGTAFRSGFGDSTVDRLGEDLWLRETYTAIPLGKQSGEGRARLDKLGSDLHGTLSFEGNAELNLEEIQILRLVVRASGTVQIENVTAKFSCDSSRDLKTTCRF